jgi:hypothetical protein
MRCLIDLHPNQMCRLAHQKPCGRWAYFDLFGAMASEQRSIGTIGMDGLTAIDRRSDRSFKWTTVVPVLNGGANSHWIGRLAVLLRRTHRVRWSVEQATQSGKFWARPGNA